MKKKILTKLAIIFTGIISAINLCYIINSSADSSTNGGQYYYPKGYRIISLSEGKGSGVLTLTAAAKNGKTICLWYEEGNSKPFKEAVFSPT